MKVLVVGSGGREHALIRKIKESPKVTEIACCPGNGGISYDAQCYPVSATDIDGVVHIAKEIKADFVVVAPDDPLVAGMVDALNEAGFAAFGPKADAAIIEGSKVFSKNLMLKYNIPTAEYKVFDKAEDVISYVREKNEFPTVIKADGLALGKGVIIPETLEEAEAGIREIMEDKIFGESGNNVVVEEFLTGPEVSVLAFTDGKCVKPMVSSMDHKRALDGDKGLNTGGMGTVSPNPYYTDDIAKECMEKIFVPTINAMNAEGRTFKGCLYFGLMITPKGPKVIEYNCRFGDPETEVVLPRLKSDFYALLDAAVDGRDFETEWSSDTTLGIVMAAKGYPGSYEKGYVVRGLENAGKVYHMGTVDREGKILTSGGRVLMPVATAPTLAEARSEAMKAVKAIDCGALFFRSDIGAREAR